MRPGQGAKPMEVIQLLNTLHFTNAADLVAEIESAGVSPLKNPREPSRRAAVEALDRLYQYASETSEPDHDLRIVGRLLASIAAINGPDKG